MRERVKDKREAGEGRREGEKRRKKREGDGEPGKRWEGPRGQRSHFRGYL